jgi:DNA repair exonuclease SbcCD nuclease subunit
MGSLVVADFHINESKRLEDTIFLLDYIFKIIYENLPIIKNLYVLGDIFDKRRPTPKELKVLNEWLMKLNCRVPVYLIVGNHDQDNGISSLTYLKDLLVPGISIITPPFKIDKFYFSHEQIDGAKTDNGMVLSGGVSLLDIIEQNPECSVFGFGHFHTPQVLNKKPFAFYAGSIDKTSFSQKDDIKCAWLFDDSHNLIKTIALPTRVMVQYNISVVKDGDKIISWYNDDLKDAMVKIVFSGTREALKQINSVFLKDLIINKYKAYSLIITYEVADKSKSRNEVINESISEEKALNEFFKDHLKKDQLIREGLKLIKEVNDNG